MKAFDIKVEYVLELLENVKLIERCSICEHTLRCLLTEAKKQMMKGDEK